MRALDAATDEIWVERRRIVESTLKLGERLQAISEEAAADFPADGEGDAEARRGASVSAFDDREGQGAGNGTKP